MHDGSIWPFDYLRGDYPVPSPEILISGSDEQNPSGFDTELRFRCFILCPFQPIGRAQALQEVVQTVLDNIRAELLRLSEPPQRRAAVLTVEMFNYSGPIHADIWRSIRTRDIIIADISDENPNVMYELGVAAAIKPALQVVIVASSAYKPNIRFDLQPLRHLFYREDLVVDMDFIKKLHEALRSAVLSLPFARRPVRSRLTLPFHIDFRGTDSDDCFSPTGVHRRSSQEGLEFGGISFPHTWLCFGNLCLRDVLVRMRVRFLGSFVTDGSDWVSISLRSSHYYANFSRVFYVARSGKSIRAVPDLNQQKGLFDERVDGANGFPSFNPGTNFFTITHGIDSEGELVGVNETLRFFTHGDPTKGYLSLADGRIMVQTWMSLVQIESVEVEAVTELRSKANLSPMETDRSRAVT